MITPDQATPQDKAFLLDMENKGVEFKEAMRRLEVIKSKVESKGKTQEQVNIERNMMDGITSGLSRGVENVKQKVIPRVTGAVKGAYEGTKEMVKGGLEFGKEGAEQLVGAFEGDKPFTQRLAEGGMGTAKLIGGAAEVAASPIFGPTIGGTTGFYKPELQEAGKKISTTLEGLDESTKEKIEKTKQFFEQNPDLVDSARSLFSITGWGAAKPAVKAAEPLVKATMEGIETGIEKAPALLKATGEAIETGIEKTGQALTKTGTALKEGAGKAGEMTLKPIKRGISEIKDQFNLSTPATVKELDQSIDDTLTKAIRPSVRGMTKTTDLVKYQDKAREAIKTIAKNKNALEFVDETTGELIKGRLPENLMEASSALTQTKKSIFEKYNQMSKAAGEAGVKLQLDEPIKKLESLANDVITRPEIRKYAKQRIGWLEQIRDASPEQIEILIKNLNEGAPNMFTSGASKIKAQVDVSIAKLLREKLDDAITNSLGSSGYQNLKNQYGSLKTIEKDLLNRALVDARKNVKGFMDVTDIFSGGDLALAALTMNPALLGKAAAQKGISTIWKSLNDPNRMIKGLFKKVDDFYSKTPLPENPNKAVQSAKTTGNVLDELGIKKNMNLPPEDLKVQDLSIEKLINNEKQLIDQYFTIYGMNINTDQARNLFRDVGYTGGNSAAVHEASSALSKKLWKEALVRANDSDAIIYAGGSGSGKSSAVSNMGLEEGIKQAILDGNLSKIDSAKARIREARLAGKNAIVRYVYRDPVDAFEYGVIKRYFGKKETGRVVPISTHVENHTGSLSVIKEIAKKDMADKLVLIDNSLGLGKTAEMSIGKLNSLKMPANLKEKLVAVLNKYKSKMPKKDFDAFMR